MNDKNFYHFTNSSTPNFPNLLRTYTTNLRQFVTPLVIRHDPQKQSSKTINKKSAKKFIPKYLYNPPHALQKEKLLYDIEKENIKLKNQHAKKKTLEKKLQKQLISYEKKAQSLQKISKTQAQTIEGIERTITTSFQKPFILQPNQSYIKSINNQIQLLTIEIQKNQEAILKIKQSKKYTRYMENEEEKNTFLSQLKNMKRYKKKIKMEINRLKRIRQEKKNLRIQELIMEGEIQNTVEMENIQIYENIQGLKQTLKQTASKKVALIKKRNTLANEIEQIKERYNITDDMIDVSFRPHTSNLSQTRYLSGYSRSVNSTQNRPFTNNLNDLGSLKEEDYEEDSTENPNYQKASACIRKNHPQKDVIRENAIETVMVHSNVDSDNEEFISLQQRNESQNSPLKENQRKAMEKLQQKYFYEDENFESEEELSYKEYDSEQYDEDEDFESDQDGQENDSQQNNRPNETKMVGVKEKKLEKDPKENQWNYRPVRGISV